MTFASPHFLYALLALPAIAVLVWWGARRGAAFARRLGDASLIERLSSSVSRPLRRGRVALWFLGVALIVVALARPQWGSEVEIVEQRGVQVMIALDISRSMLAEDIKPNRLERAKLEISVLLSKLIGDEVGIVLFSGASFIQFPLTFDYSSARAYLDHAGPDAITRQGTVIGDAIRMASRGFSDQRESQKIIIVLTDGENHEGDPAAAAAEAANEGAVVYAVGFGSLEGEPVPRYDDAGNLTGYVQDADGQTIISRLDEETLQRVANAGGGRYFRAADPTMIDNLAGEIQSYEGANIESEFNRAQVERFQLFLLAGALALFLAEFMADRLALWRRMGSGGRGEAGAHG